MSPDELRAAAKRVHVSEPFYAEACRCLADVIEALEAGDCDGARRAVLGER